MASLVEATITIKGTRPILWHWFGPDALPLEKGERSGVAGNDPTEWQRSVLMTKERQLYLEPTYVFGSVRDAARYTKKGRGNLQGAVQATVQVPDDRILVDRFLPEGPLPVSDPTQLVYIDRRSVRNPTTKARNVRYRVAASSGWIATFHLIWDKSVVSRGEMESILKDAGNLVGIGNGRTIGMGRFEVESYEVEDI